jgi:hypothetical protein
MLRRTVVCLNIFPIATAKSSSNPVEDEPAWVRFRPESDMNRFFFACIFTMAGIIVSGCDGGLLTSNRSTSAKIAQADSGERSSPGLMVTADPHD